ncbi:MAG: aminofutalosine synthase MqnE, partial [Chitinophagia bacterium]|nr:aminofutalosine synthase MqnE [Chitinophagia bacterium]
MENILRQYAQDPLLIPIIDKVYAGQRLTSEDGLYLFEHAPLALLGTLANYMAQKLHGNKVYFNKNFHIEPTNVCVFS